MLAPQVGLDHLRIAHHLARRPVGDDLAVVDDDHPVDDRHQLLELVLDHQHRGTFGMQPAEAAALVQAADRLGEQLRLGRVQAAERLVEQQQLGLGGDRARHLEPLEIAFASMLFTHSPPRRARGATSGTMTLAMIGRWRKGRMFWNVPAMPRSTTSHGRRAVMSAPRNTMLPASGLRIFVISRSSVVLPAPFGPISPTISSRRTSRLIRSTATRPPKRLVSLSRRRS